MFLHGLVLVDCILLGFPGGTVVKNPLANARDMGDAIMAIMLGAHTMS